MKIEPIYIIEAFSIRDHIGQNAQKLLVFALPSVLTVSKCLDYKKEEFNYREVFL